MGEIQYQSKIAGQQVPSAPDFSLLAAESLSSNVDNWNPVATNFGWNVDLNGADREITGIVAPVVGYVVRWILSTSGNKIILKTEDSGSIPTNRFALPDNSDYVIQNNSIATITYNTINNRWSLVNDQKSS